MTLPEMLDHVRFLNDSHNFFKQQRRNTNSEMFAYLDMIHTSSPFIRRVQY